MLLPALAALVVLAGAAPSVSPASPGEQAAVHFQDAATALEAGDFTRALTAVDHALSIERTAALYQMRSAAMSGLGRREEALADAEQALTINPDSAAGLLRRAQAREALGLDPSAALDDYRRAAQIDRGLAPIHAQAVARLAPSPWRWGNRRVRIAAGIGGLVIVFAAFSSALTRRRKAVRVRFGSVIRLSPLSAEPRAGQVVGRRYIVGKLIERRAGELVFEARDLSDNPRILRRYAAAPDGRPRPVVEAARVACALKHPGIAGPEAVFTEAEADYVALEPAAETTLARLLETAPARKLACETALAGLETFCPALDAIHSAGFLHGRLMPQDIVIDGPRWKLGGLGIAGAAAPDYLAPEIDSGSSRETDIYALGVCLFEAVCGRRPFAGADGTVSKREGRLGADLFAGLPAGADNFFARLLQPDPSRRFHSAAEVYGAFRSLVVPTVQ